MRHSFHLPFPFAEYARRFIFSGEHGMNLLIRTQEVFNEPDV